MRTINILPIKQRCLTVLLLCALSASVSFAQKENVILSAMKAEVERNKEGLKMDNLQPPFFISYHVIDIKVMDVSASMGALVSSRDNNYRAGIPKLLVGDYQRNNANFNVRTYVKDISREDNAKGIATAVWEDMDKIYKQSAEAYEAKQAVIAQRKLDSVEADLPDMELTPPIVKVMSPVETNRDRDYWGNYAMKASEVAKKYPELVFSQINVQTRNAMCYVYNTEGSQLAVPHSYHKVHLDLRTRSDEGIDFQYDLYIEHSDFKDMPTLQQFMDTCEVTIKRFLSARNAPLVKEAYSGPVLFEKQAVAEIFQNFFFLNSTLVARRKNADGSFGNYNETMKDKKLISRNLSIKSLSGSQTYKGHKLEGFIPVDLEGVEPDKELFLVENGVLRNMINGKTPTPKFPHSNGHARLNFYRHAVNIAPGNVLLTSNKTFSNADLKKKLLDAAKEEDFEYAYIIRGYQRPDIYRVYVSDGHEERVTGVTFSDLNTKSFKRILGASDTEYYYHNYQFGALSTYIVPDALLFEELEVTPENNIKFEKPYIVPKPPM